MKIEMIDTFVGVALQAFDKKTCEEVISKFESSKGLQKDLKLEDKKIGTTISLSENWRGLDEKVLSTLGNLFSQYKSTFPELELYNVSDSGYTVHRYEEGEGSFDWHCDSSHMDGSVLAMYVYLSSPVEGGTTEFLNQKLEVKPVQGNVLMVPASWTYKHRENAVESGKKYVLVTRFIRTETKDDKVD